MNQAPAAISLDLFGTLVFIDGGALPRVSIGGRERPMTINGLDELLAELSPAVTPASFLGALASESVLVEEEKARTNVEIPSRERFRRTLLALGVDAEVSPIAAVATTLSERHMHSLASAVVCPPDRVGLLAELRRSYRLMVVSNFDHGATARRLLELHGLAPHLDAIVISDDAGVRKPGPEIFEVACRRLGLTPSTCLHVGDSFEADVTGAVDAGLGALWIDAGSAPATPAAGKVADVSELPQWLAGRFGART
jgi:HAD superfamily hydrolase (TIGR01549 family)